MKPEFSPESLMMSYGYKPELSEGAIKCPVFLTSTFVFKCAEDGERFFDISYGKRPRGENEELGLIYSRINNPDLEILENRLTLWDGAEDAAVFESGMSAIATVLMEFLSPGDTVLYSAPLYGGTHHFMNHVLKKFGITAIGFQADTTENELANLIQSHKVGMIYIETPANPTNSLFDIQMCADLARHFSSEGNEIMVAVDNTYMGPIWQHPLKLGADIVMYSATKYIGGHSDIIAGAVLGSKSIISRVKTLRTFLGNMCSPHTGWMLLRSLETLKVRMDQQQLNAVKVADYLHNHPNVRKVYYLGLLDAEKDKQQHAIMRKQCIGPGAMLSFDINGGKKEAFGFLNHLHLIKLAVSLGSTESLAEHPASMTHTDIPDDEKLRYGISTSLIRLSIGVENADDLIADIEQAFCSPGNNKVQKTMIGIHDSE
jgi:methionine-gamma-lyase